jgi:hypothetical protein
MSDQFIGFAILILSASFFFLHIRINGIERETRSMMLKTIELNKNQNKEVLDVVGEILKEITESGESK